ncbi:phage portal protein [Parasedimentitalea psychrophila]|uniref:Phage portal protein n=1 Tax=Parasedimentitalea psychrophila TaxID=2997337 RepID=A0A9Y2L2N4_9RHOB|nr:phage portal protein [Parasedimentitalea psychrophila]WIY27635.1 phage portal protein [Parasedimentitalea psychrophila]
MVFDVLRRKQPPIEQKASAVARVVSWQAAGRAAWSPRDSQSLIRSGFIGNPVGFRCVKLIAEAAAALPLVLQDQVQRFEQHPLLGLLARPNMAQGRAELLEALFGQLLLTGNAYVEAVAGDQGLPLELHVLRSERMSVVPGTDGWPLGYDYKVAGRKHHFAAVTGRVAICHIKSFHPQDDHYGLSPLQAAAMAVDVHNSASRWSKALLDNAARPSGALVWKGSDGQGVMGDDQFRRLSDEIEANFQGARNAGRPMVLEGGLDWKPMGFSPSDMEFQQTKEAAREIALAFGVPPMLLGIQGDATYANYQEANRAFYRLTVVPLVARVAAALMDWLSGFDGAMLTLKPDLDQVAALSTERDAQWARVAKAEFLSRSEKRSLLGLPPEDGGPGDG